VYSQFYFILGWRSHIDWPIIKFLVTLSTPKSKWSLLTSNCKIETNMMPLWLTSLVCIHESWTLGENKVQCDKCEVLLGTSWEKQLGNPMGTWWEHIGNMGKTQEKNWTPHEWMNEWMRLSLLPIGFMKQRIHSFFVLNLVKFLLKKTRYSSTNYPNYLLKKTRYSSTNYPNYLLKRLDILQLITQIIYYVDLKVHAFCAFFDPPLGPHLIEV